MIYKSTKYVRLEAKVHNKPYFILFSYFYLIGLVVSVPSIFIGSYIADSIEKEGICLMKMLKTKIMEHDITIKIIFFVNLENVLHFYCNELSFNILSGGGDLHSLSD